MSFANTSQPLVGVTFQWNFGDGQFSAEQDPQNLYLNEGDFNVQLIVTLGNCSDSTVSSVTVNPRPSSGFIATPDHTTAIEPLITFEDVSTDAISWDWDFGDGILTTEQHPSHNLRRYRCACDIADNYKPIWLYRYHIGFSLHCCVCNAVCSFCLHPRS